MPTTFFRHLLLPLLLAVIIAPGQLLGVAQAQSLDGLLSGQPSALGSKPKAKLRPTAKAELVSLPASEIDPLVELRVTVKLPPGHYIYGMDGEFAGRTVIETMAKGLEPVSEFQPNRPGKQSHDPVFDLDLTKFDDEVTWSRRYRIVSAGPKDNGEAGTSAASNKPIEINGTVTGQYCSAAGEGGGQCFPLIPALTFTASLAEDRSPTTSSPENASPPALPKLVQTIRPERNKKPGPISLTFKLAPVPAEVGKLRLSILAELDKGWHTFSLTQSDIGGSPTEIHVAQVSGLAPITEGFTADPPFTIDEPLPDTKLEIHEPAVAWSRDYQVTGSEPIGIAGEISYQVCKDGTCLPLKTIQFALGTVPSAQQPTISNGNAMSPSSGSPATAAAKPAGQSPGRTGTGPRPLASDLWGILLLSIAGGYAALLTPCVFPMIPITVGFFLKQGSTNPRRTLSLAIVYSLSIIIAFTVFGLGLSVIFGVTFLNSLSNNPWLNSFIGLVFIAFGFNMLGVFEIVIPSSLLTFTANRGGGGGYIGVIFMALTFTLTSFTCTFAIVASLMAGAAQGSILHPIVGMLGFSTAFASPFFFLALFPGWLQSLPRSGGWMYRVKVVLGLIELGAALKFLSMADQAWNPTPMVFDFTLVMLLWAAISLVAAMYLLGIFRLPHDRPDEPVSVTQLMFSLAFMTLAGFLGIGLLTPERSSGLILPQILAFAPPRFENTPTQQTTSASQSVADHPPGPMQTHHGLRFAMDTQEAFAFAKAKQLPLFLDFTGVNCVNCRLMEQKMAAPNLHERLQKFVRVQAYTDIVPLVADRAYAKQLLEGNIQLQLKLFGEVALPTYAIMSPDGETLLASYSGLELVDGEFARFLDDGWQRWQAQQGVALTNP